MEACSLRLVDLVVVSKTDGSSTMVLISSRIVVVVVAARDLSVIQNIKEKYKFFKWTRKQYILGILFAFILHVPVTNFSVVLGRFLV